MVAIFAPALVTPADEVAAEIAEMHLNPVTASPDGVVAVDAKVRIAPRHPEPDLALRELR